MNKFKYIILFTLIIGTTQTYGQQGLWKLHLNMQAAFPGGQAKNMFDKASLRGWGGAVMYGATDQLQVGLEAGFQDFYQKNSRQVYSEPGSDISAVITHSVQTIPVMVKGRYQFTTEGMLRPFAGVGAGINLVQYSKYYGQFADSDTRLGFAAQPELGVHIPLGASGTTGINIAAGYNFMPYQYDDADGLSGPVIKAGVSFPLR